MTWEREVLGESVECDKNTLYGILKELIKNEGKNERGRGVTLPLLMWLYARRFWVVSTPCNRKLAPLPTLGPSHKKHCLSWADLAKKVTKFSLYSLKAPGLWLDWFRQNKAFGRQAVTAHWHKDHSNSFCFKGLGLDVRESLHQFCSK